MEPHTTGQKLDELLALPQSDCKPIQKVDIQQHAMVLYNVLSPSECDFLIEKCEEIGIPPGGFDLSLRNVNRLCVFNTSIAEMLYNRVRTYIDDVNITSQDDQSVTNSLLCEGHWKPFGLNTYFRICKYDPEGHFGIIDICSYLRTTL